MIKNTTFVGMENDSGRIIKMDKVVVDRDTFRIQDYISYTDFHSVTCIFFDAENHKKFGINYSVDEENYDYDDYENKNNYINKIKEDGGVVLPVTWDYIDGIIITDDPNDVCGYICFKKEDFWRIGNGNKKSVLEHLNMFVNVVNTIYVKEELYYFTYVANGETKCIKSIINTYSSNVEFWNSVKRSLPWIDGFIDDLRNNLNIPLTFHKFYMTLDSFCFCPDLLPENCVHLSYYDAQTGKFVVKLRTHGFLNCEIIYDKSEILIKFYNSKQSVLMKKTKSGKIKVSIFNGCGREINNFTVSQNKDKNVFLKDYINEEFNMKFLNTIIK